MSTIDISNASYRLIRRPAFLGSKTSDEQGCRSEIAVSVIIRDVNPRIRKPNNVRPPIAVQVNHETWIHVYPPAYSVTKAR